MSTPHRALWLAWGAVVALLAYPAGAQIIGQQSGIMGGDSGFLRPVGGAPATLTLDAMPYTRTVTCGSYTLTGTYTGSVPTWSASPSGASGTCSDSGGGAFSCVVSIAPDAAGEGVETITVTNGATDTVTIGFYVSGAHSCFLAQSVDGSYNSSLADLDPVATWENLGSSALDVTQGTGTAQPTFRTSIVGGQPVVRCDGGDSMQASTALDWAFLTDAADWSQSIIMATSSANPNTLMTVTSTHNIAAPSTSRGVAMRYDDRSASSIFDRFNASGGNGSAVLITFNGTDGTFLPQVFSDMLMIGDENGIGSDDWFFYVNNSSVGAAVRTQSYSALAPDFPLTLCKNPTGTAFQLTGDLFRILIYQSALDATQRGINKAVDEWALGGSLPVLTAPLWTPAALGASLAVWLDANDASTITLNGSTVSQWSDKSGNGRDATQQTASLQPTYTASGIGGKPSLTFAPEGGTAQDRLNVTFTLTENNITAFVLARKPSSSGTLKHRYGRVLSLRNTSGTDYNNTDGWIPAFMAQSDAFGGVNAPSIVNFRNNAAITVQPMVYNTPYIIGSTLSGSTSTLRVNGNETSGTTSATAVNINQMMIGARSDGADSEMYGDIAEVIVTPALSLADQQRIEGYLAWKWGIEANLPVGHPYKSAPPTL